MAELAEPDEEREYVPTLVERIAEAIPTELTATPHVGIGGARRLKIAHAVLPIVQAELELIEAATRRQVAEEIAVAIELARGDRCPECKGWHASKRTPRGTTSIDYRCGCGHTWRITYASPWTDPTAIARGRGETGGGQ